MPGEEQQQQTAVETTTTITEDSTNSEIQSSAQVNPQFLLLASVPSSPAYENNCAKRSMSRSRLGTDDNVDEVSGHYEGEMERFFQSEVRPVYFGGKNDAYLLLKVTVIAGLLVNLFGVLVYMKYDNKIPENPSEHHPHGLLKLLTALESALAAYCSDGQIVVGWMLSCWFLGFNVISAMIWWQFERRESRPADDYEIIPSFRMRRRGTGANSLQNNQLNDPAVSHDSFKRFSRSQSLNKQHQQQADEQNPFDKSVIVISMPNGDFSVGKRQKGHFNQ